MMPTLRYRFLQGAEAWRALVPSLDSLQVVKRAEAESPDALLYYPVLGAGKRRQTVVIFANRAPALYQHSITSLITGLKKLVFALSPKMDEIRKQVFDETPIHEVYRRPPAIVSFLNTWLFPLTAGTSQDTVWIAGQSLTHWEIEDDQIKLIFATHRKGIEVQLTWGHLTQRQLNLLIQYNREVSASWREYYLGLYGRVLSPIDQGAGVRLLHVSERQRWLRNLVLSHRDEIEEVLNAHSSDFIMKGFWEEWWAIFRHNS